MIGTDYLYLGAPRYDYLRTNMELRLDKQRIMRAARSKHIIASFMSTYMYSTYVGGTQSLMTACSCMALFQHVWAASQTSPVGIAPIALVADICLEPNCHRACS